MIKKNIEEMENLRECLEIYEKTMSEILHTLGKTLKKISIDDPLRADVLESMEAITMMLI